MRCDIHKIGKKWYINIFHEEYEMWLTCTKTFKIKKEATAFAMLTALEQ